jgi:diguanylate cyclase (GGDEF)-like protein
VTSRNERPEGDALELVAHLAVRLEDRPADELDAAIDDLLAELGPAADADRAYTFVRSGQHVRNTQEWCAPGIEPQIGRLQAVPVEVIAHWRDAFERGDPVVIPSVAALDPAERPEVDLLAAQGIRSMLAVPLRSGGRWTGFVGFDAVRSERTWSPSVRQVLRLTAHLIGIALARSTRERATRQRFDVMLELASATIVLFDRNRRVVAFNPVAAERSRRHYGVELAVGDRVDTPTFDADLRRALAGEEVHAVRGPEHRPRGVPAYWSDVTLRPVRDDDGTVTGAVYHSVDITEQVRARRSLERGNRLRQALLGLARAALVQDRATEPLQHVLEQAVRHVPGAEAGSVLRLDDDGRFRFVAAVGFDLSVLAPLSFPPDAISEPAAADVTRGPRLLPHVLDDPEVRAAFAATSPTAAIAATVSVPIVVQGRTAGYLQLNAFSDADAFGDDSLEAGRLLGDLVGALVQRLDLERVLLAERARFDHLAHHDPLTGLPNRVLLADRLAQALARDGRSGHATALMVVDLDGFKSVNDAFGHAVGDELLAALARRLADVLRSADTVARLGGDEFAIVAAGLASASSADGVARKVLNALHQPIAIAGREVRVGASIGVSVAPNDGADAATLLANADLAMYRTKRGGRGAVAYFTPELDARMRERAQLTEDLRAALRDGAGIHVAFQPQVRLDGSGCVGVEALARWDHPSRGAVPPSTFVPIAEESGLVQALSDHVFDVACAGFARLRGAGFAPGGRLALNVAPQELRAGDLGTRLARITERHGLTARDLDLEVTESVMADEHADVLDPLRRLRTAGARVAIDDFGTGYSSLHRLAVLPVDVLKVDRSFVQRLGVGRREEALVDGVLALAAGLGLEAVAEGVETEAQRAALLARGCTIGQGYLFGRPMAEADLQRWHAERTAT